MQEIDEIMAQIIADLGYEKATQMFLGINSGKKIRSKLLLKIAKKSEISLKLCAIIELIHLASLLHDDVIDKSDTRRNKPSINALFGNKFAIMLGDILYSKGFFELSKFDPNIAQTISNAVSLLSIGEMMDVEMSENFNTNEAKYFQMIYFKTAVLIEASAKCGAILANLNSDDFAKYGKNLGLAFQIIDDILDIVSDEKTLGKPVLSDFKEGKTTLAYIYLYECLNQNDKEKLLSLFKRNLDKTEQIWIKSKFNEHKIIQKCKQKAVNLANSALDCVEKYQISSLNEMVQNVVNREF